MSHPAPRSEARAYTNYLHGGAADNEKVMR
jgi:hypothetical protein